MDNTIIVLVLQSGSTKPVVKEINNNLKDLQEIVGGYIEVISFNANLVIIVNEEGKLLNLSPTMRFRNDVLVGNIIFARTEQSEFISLSDQDIERIQRTLFSDF